MKKYMHSFLFILFFISNLLHGQDKNQAINDYLDTVIKDKNQKLIIIKEKINSDKTIEIFRGTVYLDPTTKKLVREGGVEKPLYNDKDWEIMKNKYKNKLPIGAISSLWLKNSFWCADNFSRKNVIFEELEEFYKRLEKGESYSLENAIEIYSFSNPIFYKKNKYVVFTVEPSKTNSITFFHEFIIVMKKVNNKWIIINKTFSNVFY